MNDTVRKALDDFLLTLPAPQIANIAEADERGASTTCDAFRAGYQAGRADAGWRPISEAPMDGTHIIAASFDGYPNPNIGFGWCGKNGTQQPFVDIVHWGAWPNDDDGDLVEGFYSSYYGADQESPNKFTHWKPIDEAGATP